MEISPSRVCLTNGGVTPNKEAWTGEVLAWSRNGGTHLFSGDPDTDSEAEVAEATKPEKQRIR